MTEESKEEDYQPEEKVYLLERLTNDLGFGKEVKIKERGSRPRTYIIRDKFGKTYEADKEDLSRTLPEDFKKVS